MSIAVITYYLLGAHVKPEGQFNGFVLTLDYPDNAIIVLWVVWSWSLLRYVQRVYELWSLVRDEFIEDVNAEDQRMVFARAKKLGNRLAAQGKLGANIPTTAQIKGEISFGKPEIEDSIPSANEPPRIFDPLGFYKTNKGARNYPRFQANFIWATHSNIGSFPLTLTPTQAKWLRIRAWFHAILRLPGFGEYFAPIIATAGALIAPVISCMFA